MNPLTQITKQSLAYFDEKFPVSIDYPYLCSHRTEIMIAMEIEARTKRAQNAFQAKRNHIIQSHLALVEALEDIIKDTECSYPDRWKGSYVDAEQLSDILTTFKQELTK